MMGTEGQVWASRSLDAWNWFGSGLRRRPGWAQRARFGRVFRWILVIVGVEVRARLGTEGQAWASLSLELELVGVEVQARLGTEGHVGRVVH